MTDRRIITYARVLFAIYVICVLVLCLMNFKQHPDVPEFFLGIPADKCAHFLMFFPFPILFRLSLNFEGAGYRKKMISAFAILAAGCIFAAMTEYLQGLTPYRTTEILDFAADSAGMSLSTIAVLLFDIYKRKNEQR